jgi:hypothetical protein
MTRFLTLKQRDFGKEMGMLKGSISPTGAGQAMAGLVLDPETRLRQMQPEINKSPSEFSGLPQS